MDTWLNGEPISVIIELIKQQDLPQIEEWLRKGGDPTGQSHNHDHPPVGQAIYHHADRALEILMRPIPGKQLHPSLIHHYLIYSCITGTDRALELLIQAGGDPFDHRNRGRPPLLTAISNNKVSKVRIILNSKLKSEIALKLKTFYPLCKQVILHAVDKYGNLEIVSLLLEAGADPFAIDVSGDTPASYCRKDQSRNYELAVQLLERYPRFQVFIRENKNRLPRDIFTLIRPYVIPI